MIKLNYIISLIFILNTSSLWSQRIVKIMDNLVLIDTDVNIGNIDDEVEIQRIMNSYVVTVGIVKLRKFGNGKTAASIVKIYQKLQVGDFVKIPKINASSNLNNFNISSYQDVVSLKNGIKIYGIIVEQYPNRYIKIQTRNGSILLYQISEISKISKKQQQPVQKLIKNEKSPGIAFVLSLVLPGLGQYYNGEIGKGITHNVIAIGSAWLSIYQVVQYNYVTTLYWVGVGVGFINYLWSLVDAPISADNINKRRNQRYGHLFEYNFKNNTIGLDIINNNGFSAKLSYHF